MGNGLGMYLRDERRKQKMTLRELSKKSGIDYSMISKYENGIVTPPPEKLRRIADALQIDEESMHYDVQALNRNMDSRRNSNIGDLYFGQLPTPREATITQNEAATADGRCELCGEIFPDADLFLEPYHVICLQDDGTPTVERTVFLCPNCNKRIRIYQNPYDIKKLLKSSDNQKLNEPSDGA